MIEETNGEFVKEHTIRLPFSPPIYQSKFNSSELKVLQELAEDTRNSFRLGNKLSGNIQEQRAVESLEQNIFYILAPHIREYVKFFTEKIKLSGNTGYDTDDNEIRDYSKLNFSLSALWFNYMTKNEFNPMHLHTGLISGVLMIKVPEEISQEHISIPIESNARCPGMLEWIRTGYGSGFYRKYPVEGEIYLFPSELHHQVYPYASDVERITASFNVAEINFS